MSETARPRTLSECAVLFDRARRRKSAVAHFSQLLLFFLNFVTSRFRASNTEEAPRDA